MTDNVQSSDSATQKSCAIRPRYRRIVVRPVFDAVVAWFVFGLLTAFVTCAPLTAATSPAGFEGLEKARMASAIPAVGDSGDAAPMVNLASAHAATTSTAHFQATHNPVAMTLLGIAFSFFAAVNLMFVRHLRRAYARPRKRPSTTK